MEQFQTLKDYRNQQIAKKQQRQAHLEPKEEVLTQKLKGFDIPKEIGLGQSINSIGSNSESKKLFTEFDSNKFGREQESLDPSEPLKNNKIFLGASFNLDAGEQAFKTKPTPQAIQFTQDHMKTIQNQLQQTHQTFGQHQQEYQRSMIQIQQEFKQEQQRVQEEYKLSLRENNDESRIAEGDSILFQEASFCKYNDQDSQLPQQTQQSFQQQRGANTQTSNLSPSKLIQLQQQQALNKQKKPLKNPKKNLDVLETDDSSIANKKRYLYKRYILFLKLYKVIQPAYCHNGICRYPDSLRKTVVFFMQYLTHHRLRNDLGVSHDMLNSWAKRYGYIDESVLEITDFSFKNDNKLKL